MIIPVSREYDSTYENFEAICPHCKRVNIFNRATDLKTFQLVTGKNVTCLFEDCEKEFRIVGDKIGPAWRNVLFDLYKLKELKYYTYCILNLAQVFEMYFALFLRVNLLYKPFSIEKEHNVDFLNILSKSLFVKTQKWTYSPLKNTFLNFIYQNITPSTLLESQMLIDKLNTFAKKEPSDLQIKLIGNKKLSTTLIELKNNSVPSLRNNVIHKDGYRPTLDEVNIAEEESAKILYSLDNCLMVLSDDLNFYESTF